jgi:outer membrane protein assembly factor BamB
LGADKESREKARDAWLKWWQTNSKDVDLSKLDATERMFGYTLVIETDFRGIGGRIMEIGPDGKKRWDISSLQYPTDAVVIPGDRVIVAEQNTNHISERDIKTGKENWGEDFNQPIGLQRLANGNLVVIGRHQIVEWDHARKELKKITRPQSDIVAGAKLRDGQFLAFTQMGLFVTYDKDGKYVSQFKVSPRPGMWSTMQVLPDGKVLITQMGGVSEVDLNKKEAVMVMTHNNPMSAQRLPNGNILVTGQNNTLVTEYDPRTKKSVWDFRLIDNNNGFYRPLRAKRR